MPEKWVLQELQHLPLLVKVRKSQLRIREWYDHFNGKVCVSFSGGKDSTVLAHLVHEIYPDVPLVFANTGLEYPEIQAFARKMGAEFVRPAMRFDQVISTYGYPIISKEVSSAIYYARRIKNANGQSNSAIEGSRDSVPDGFKTTEYYQRMLQGQPGVSKDGTLLPSSGWEDKTCGKRNQLLGGITRVLDQKTNQYISTKKKRTELLRERTAQNGQGEQVTSIYNKKKWLPVCRDTQFRISGKCCSVMKKGPMRAYQLKTNRMPYIGTLTEESKMREQAWLKNGCNAFESHSPSSQPLSFWTEQDILKYLYVEGYEIASVYGEIVGVDDYGMEYDPMPGVDCKLKCSGCQRTGCMFCGFGAHHDKEKGALTRFQRLAKTHPKQYEYCMRGGQWVDNPDYDPAAPKMDGDWENWNPKKIWVPSKEGLGMKKVFDDCNQIYGKDFIAYE